jgi:hypothetical protein
MIYRRNKTNKTNKTNQTNQLKKPQIKVSLLQKHPKKLQLQKVAFALA